MTDDEIRDVFAELRRIGVDLGQPPGLAIGTGFRDGELLAWLRHLPDNFGHDAFAERLREHVVAAAPNASAPSPKHEHRLWPTVEQLNAGIDVLIAEWDPLSARLGDLSREDVSTHAFNALGAILRSPSDAASERRVAAMLGDVETEVLGVRRSPIEQRRYLARCLIQVVVDHPGPEHDANPFAADAALSPAHARASGGVRVRGRKRNFVEIGPRGDELPPLDAAAACTECGSIGTIAVVMREIEPHTSRYCLPCWTNVRGRYWHDWLAEANGEKDKPESMIRKLEAVFASQRERVRYAASAMWDDRLIMFRRMINAAEDEPSEKRQRDLRWIANQLARMEPTMFGPMPADIRAFVDEHATQRA
jgi:hypothetical protein